MTNTLSKIAVAYGVMWLLSFWIQNIIYITIVSGFGVALLVYVAIGTESSFQEIDENKANMKIELEKIVKEIDELKNSGKTQIPE